MQLKQPLTAVKRNTYNDLLASGRRQLRAAVGEASIEAEALLRFACHKSAAQLIAASLEPVDAEVGNTYRDLIERRLGGEPVAYLIGEREFWSLTLVVTPDVLIPRAETELLLEQALLQLESLQHPAVLDLGTGSGAIALAIAHQRPEAKVLATDKSRAALKLAETNAKRLGIDNISFVHSDWYQQLGQPAKDRRFDLIVSNPPYVVESDPHLNRGDLRFEPKIALIAAAQGLQHLATIIAAADAHLKPGGWLMVEQGYQQAAAVQVLFSQAGFTSIQCFNDYGGIERVTIGRLQNNHVV